LSTFKAFNSDIVIGCEWYCGSAKNCGSVPAWWKNQGFTKCPTRKYINAGCIVGRVSALKLMLSSLLNQNFEDDQLALASWVNENPHKCALDYGSSLVYNAHILDMHKTPSTSYFLHYPGPMFKHRLFPRYNNDLKQILGTRGRLVYAKEWIYLIIYSFILILSIGVLYKLV